MDKQILYQVCSALEWEAEIKANGIKKSAEIGGVESVAHWEGKKGVVTDKLYRSQKTVEEKMDRMGFDL